MSCGSGSRKQQWQRFGAKRVGLIVGVTWLFVLLCSLAMAEPPSTSLDRAANSKGDTQPEQRALPQVTIDARRQAIEHQAFEFVRQATHNLRFQYESLPRWNTPLCFAIAGLPTDQGVYALGRLREIARAAGARVARPGCHYNFYVVFTAEPDTLLKKAFRDYSKAFDQCDGPGAVKAFIAPSKPRPVRVWHNVKPFRRDGMPIDLPSWCGGVVANHKDLPLSLQYFPTRLERYDVMAFSLALVVVDTTYAKPEKLGGLVDYAAIVGLADIDLDADLGDAPSILRLFDPSPDHDTSGLTAWDRAFLSALYHSDPATQTHRSQMAVQMSLSLVP